MYNKIDVYGDKIGYIESHSASNANIDEESRIAFAAKVASICVDASDIPKQNNNPSKLYNKLLKEAAPNIIGDTKGKASRPLEFIPIVTKYRVSSGNEYSIKTNNGTYKKIPESVFFNDIVRFSYIHEQRIYTNLRTLANVLDYSEIPYNTEEELKSFKVLRCKLPMFVWAHIVRHTQLSIITKTSRRKENIDYWFPTDLNDRIKKNIQKSYDFHKSSQLFYGDIIDSNKKETEEIRFIMNAQGMITQFFKDMGYKSEIFQRGIFYMQYKTFYVSAWLNDNRRWDHLFIERNNYPEYWRNWTQVETQQAVSAMKTLLYG